MHILYYAHLCIIDFISLVISDTSSFLGLNISRSVFSSKNFNECSLHCFHSYNAVIFYFRGKKAFKGLISYPLDENEYISSIGAMIYRR
jgi:hypothetical protein